MTPNQFMNSVRVDNGGCWIWVRGRTGEGYGWARYQGKPIGSHRLSWIVFRGSIPDGLFICHSCDVRECVNPSHLFLGTPKDNLRDMRAKKRGPEHTGNHVAIATPHKMARGIKHGQAKLTDEDVKEIRKSDKTDTELSRKYRVARSTIRRARDGLTWAHINQEM